MNETVTSRETYSENLWQVSWPSVQSLYYADYNINITLHDTKNASLHLNDRIVQKFNVNNIKRAMSNRKQNKTSRL